MQLNQTFISNIKELYGPAGYAWLAGLPVLIEQLSMRWNFRLLHPMQDLSYNFVGLVEIDPPPQTAIIKIAPKETKHLVTEMKWLNCIDKGVVQIYSYDEDCNSYLMEHLQPGYSLKKLVQAGADDEATKHICQVIRDLHSQHRIDFQFPHLSTLLNDFSILKGRFDAHLLSQAQSWFDELTKDKSNDIVLHGDLHHDNILASGSAWKTIDPHGYIGDAAAEVGAMIRNPLDCFPSRANLDKIIARRLQILSDELSFEPQKIKAWTFCMTVLSIAWTFESHKKIPELETEVAIAIDKVKI